MAMNCSNHRHSVCVRPPGQSSSRLHNRAGGHQDAGGVHGYVIQSSLPAELVELAYLRASQMNNCAYCLGVHTRDRGKKNNSYRLLSQYLTRRTGLSLHSRAKLSAIAKQLIRAIMRFPIKSRPAYPQRRGKQARESDRNAQTIRKQSIDDN
jgi:AhpD family alkylhydroperoxidase